MEPEPGQSDSSGASQIPRLRNPGWIVPFPRIIIGWISPYGRILIGWIGPYPRILIGWIGPYPWILIGCIGPYLDSHWMHWSLSEDSHWMEWSLSADSHWMDWSQSGILIGWIGPYLVSHWMLTKCLTIWNFYFNMTSIIFTTLTGLSGLYCELTYKTLLLVLKTKYAVLCKYDSLSFFNL